MKILIVDTYYHSFLQNFYFRHGEMADYNYQRHKETLMAEKFGTADFYSSNLRELGHQAEDIVMNDEILQKKWARENGVFHQKYLIDKIPFVKLHFKSNWQEEILEQQILAYKPDVLYCQDLYLGKSPRVKFLRKLKREIKVFVVGQVASPIDFDKEFLSLYDLILSSFPHFVDRFRSLGVKSEYFRIGFEETILGKLQKTKKQYDATFIGGFSKRLLEAVSDFWGYGVDKTQLSPTILKKYHGQIWGINMYNILYNSKIVLNRHIDVAGDHANNMRLYESTGVGSMLITDFKSDLNKLFTVGKEVETYKSKGELLEKVKYYLAHDRERLNIAMAGQRRTLREHTYRKRMKELIGILEKYL